MLSILLASQGQLTIACGLIFLAAVFDVFDGLAARAMGGGSPLGAQLDSLADMVSFGVAPGMLVWSGAGLWLAFDAVTIGYTVYPPLSAAPQPITSSLGGVGLPPSYWLVMAAVLWIPVASAWRLAKFNIDARQSTGFLGLPTPANALFWASVVWALHDPYALDYMLSAPSFLGAISSIWEGTPTGPEGAQLCGTYAALFLLGTSALLGILMLSELPLPSLKFKHFKWKGNEVIYSLLGVGLLLVALYGVLAVPLILVVYLLSPLWVKLFR